MLCKTVLSFLNGARDGDLQLVQQYLLSGGDVNIRLGDYWTALHHAVNNRQRLVVDELVRHAEIDLNLTTM